MKKKIKWYVYPIAVMVVIYRIVTKRVYYVVLTGIDRKTKMRMFGRTSFITYGNIFPIKSLEDKFKETMGWESCVVLNFYRMKKSQVKYLTQNLEFEIKYIDSLGIEFNNPKVKHE